MIESQLSASIVVDEDIVKVGQDIHFEAVASNSIGDVSYRWDFTNDGTIDSTARELDRDYDDEGTKVVNLTGLGINQRLYRSSFQVSPRLW